MNTLACMLFGAISGSATAAISSIGGTLIPEMNRAGYKREFSVALTATAATTGLLIPPSNVMVVYSLASGGVSIAALFVAGYVPGILLGLVLMLVGGRIAKQRGYPVGERVGLAAALRILWSATPSLALILVVMGGIILGWFTPTEAAAIGAALARRGRG